jgi:hypothetical protein
MTASGNREEQYEIVIGRRLGSRSARQFEGFDLVDIDGDGMLLRGRLPDQAALHGVLARIRDLGIPLLEVRRAGVSDQPE